ncbi:MAG: F0F1 ATP synthase subunit delta [Candidatus Nanopelagicales bacterium]
MIGSSRASLATVDEAVAAAYDNPGLEQAGRDLLQVADLVGREKPLRNALSDAGRPAAERTTMLSDLLAGQISPLGVELSGVVAGLRWSSASDLVDAFEYAGVGALFGAAEKQGQLDRVENELFRFGRVAVTDPDLQMALSSPALPVAAKNGILTDLLSGQTSPVTLDVLSFVTSHLRGRRLDQAVDQMVDLAAQRRGSLVATVRVARPLEGDQQQRLTAALERIYQQPVSTNVEVDPSLVGGITVQIGDEVIDGSISARLENARRRVTG